MYAQRSNNSLRKLLSRVPVAATASQARDVAPLLAFLVRPLSLTAYVLAAWRVGADLRWVEDFFITSGVFSRWQVWLAIAITTHILAHQANRPTRPDDPVAS